MAKYNWRMHVWNIGDRCVVKSRGQTTDFWRGTVTDVSDPDRLRVRFDRGYDGCPRYAECVPLRKRAPPRMWWLCVYDKPVPYVFGKNSFEEANQEAHPGARLVRVKEIRE